MDGNILSVWVEGWDNISSMVLKQSEECWNTNKSVRGILYPSKQDINICVSLMNWLKNRCVAQKCRIKWKSMLPDLEDKQVQHVLEDIDLCCALHSNDDWHGHVCVSGINYTYTQFCSLCCISEGVSHSKKGTPTLTDPLLALVPLISSVFPYSFGPPS